MSGFAEGASANVTMPSSGIIEDGYPDYAIFPAAEANWLIRQATRGRRVYSSLRAAALAGVELGTEAVDLRAARPIGESIAESAKVVVTGYEALLAYGRGMVFCVYDDVQVVAAFDADTLTYLWEHDCSANVSALAYGGGMLLVGHDSASFGRKLTVLDAATGAELGYYTNPASQAVRSLAYGEVDGVGYVARSNVGGSYIYIHNLTDFSVDGDLDHGDMVHWVAARGSLVAVAGIQTPSHGNISLLDCSVPSAPADIWTVSRTYDPTSSWCGFVGDFVALLERGGGNGLLLYPIARFATAPSAAATLTVNVISGATPAIGDWGVAYERSGGSKLMFVSPELEQMCLSVEDGIMSAAWAGDRMLCATSASKLRAVSARTRPVRVTEQFGLLAVV